MTQLCRTCFQDAVEGGVCTKCKADQAEPGRDRRALPVWTVVDDTFLIGRVLGSGGFGITYLAQHVHLAHRVALKEFFPTGLAIREGDRLTIACNSLGDQPPFDRGLTKFFNEGRTLARFNHPNIVRAIDVRRANGTAYLAMEYLDGVTLKKRIAEAGRLATDKALTVIAFVIDALKEIHAEHVIHRDLKPDNIYVTNKGRILLLDFGGAKQLTAENDKSMDTMFAHGYAAPEQYFAESGKMGPWTDVYACAATLYKMLTGQTMKSALDRYGEDPPLTWADSDAPAHVRKAIARALTLDHKKRFQTIQEFDQALGSQPTGPDPDPDPTTKGPVLKSVPLAVKIGVAALLCLVVGVVVYVASGRKPAPAPPVDRVVTTVPVKPVDAKPPTPVPVVPKPVVPKPAPLTEQEIKDRFNAMYVDANAGNWKAVEISLAEIKASDNGVVDPAGGAPDEAVTAGRKALQASEYARAKSIFDNASKQHPADAAAWAGLGQAQLRLGDLKDAKGSLVRALRIKPDDPNAWLQLAEVTADANPKAPVSAGMLRLAVYLSTKRQAGLDYLRALPPEEMRPEFAAVLHAHATELDQMPERKK